MKRIICLAVVTGVMAMGAQAFGGWGLPSLPVIGGIGGDSGAKVDVGALTARECVLKARVNKATVSLANGLVSVQKACGKATDAAKLEAALAEVQKDPNDIEKTKDLCAKVNNASDAMKAVDLNAAMNKDEARKHLGESLLHLGAGTLLEAQASTDAAGLVKDITSSVKTVQSSPMTYGLSAAKNLLSGLSTAKFVAETVPSQLSSIGELTSGLVKYAQTNKIEIPSLSKQKDLAAQMGKE